MRRGHTGIGGWRNENIRHFRPRGGGNQQFRPREYLPLDITRFPPPILRGYRPPPYASRSGHTIDNFRGNNRNKFRYENRKNPSRTYENHNERQIFQQPKHFTHNEMSSQTKKYKDSNHYDKPHQSSACHVNSHGDIDLRLSSVNTSHLTHRNPLFTTWTHPDEHKQQHYDDRNQNKPHKYNDDVNKLSYPGHRPPSSDHYGGNPTSIIENSKTYSRTVDDTVNIIRKRILDRNESLHTSDNLNIDNSHNNSFLAEETLVNFYDTQQEQPTRRRIQRQKQKVKSNCDKIKNKIVHQLFKMDKEKIHKLMDNPNSSSKFEYAISSLITESQNSYNRHLRSVAEKSLCDTSTEFITNDNNTIYEDTFLKQMQCILDPQDTVFLEDIKPFVMAELSKVLQIEDFEQQHIDGESSRHVNNEQFSYDEYPSNTINYENYSSEYLDMLPADQHQAHTNYPEPEIETIDVNVKKNISLKPSIEPRQRAKSCSYSDDRGPPAESLRYARHSLDNKSNEIYKSDDIQPLFDPNSKCLSEDEDPFAELDNQYHVAVDPNFIADDTLSSQQSQTDSTAQPLLDNSFSSSTENNKIDNIKLDIDNQILNIAKSPLKLHVRVDDKDNVNERENINSNIKQSTNKQKGTLTDYLHTINSFTVDEIPIPGENHMSVESKKVSHTSSTPKSLRSSNSRKRPIDQQSSHRKEKRKKVDNGPPDSNKKKDNKKNMNDLPSKTLEEPQTKNEKNVCKTKVLTNKTEKAEIVEMLYSNKYVKRKDVKKQPEKQSDICKKIYVSVSSSHSNSTATDSTITITPPKGDPKNTLKPIDMFMQKPKKVIIHQAHRNTAVVPSTNYASTSVEKEDGKKKNASKIFQHDAATQVHVELLTKDTQTTEDTFCPKCLSQDNRLVEEVQINPTYMEADPIQSSVALGRMKEIDLQIQILVEEKLKLYRSLGINEPSEDSLQTLGIAILNMPQVEEENKDDSAEKDCSISYNAIMDDVTNIPFNDFVALSNDISNEIANNTTSDNTNEAHNNRSNGIHSSKVRKLTRRRTNLDQERISSVSPRLTKKLNKKDKSPNISLIEQILKDDRPLEEIITLDDYEKPIRTRKSQRVQRTKNKNRKIQNPPINLNDLNIIEIRECSVVLVREDLNKLLAQYTIQHSEHEVLQYEPLECASFGEEVEITDKENSDTNDIQIDMLDVSEDITIDNNYEVKSSQDKELEIPEVPISEEIIVGNSQSSEEDALMLPPCGESECKMFDFASDENLRRDSITVTGHADAVLAIECIDNNFVAACLDGNVYYFSGDGQLINTLKGSNLAVTCLTIVKDKYETTVYTGSLDSRIRYYDLETGIEKGPECNVLSPIQTMDRAWDTVFVGTRTGFVLQFECKNNMLIPVSTVKFSEQSILALRAMKEGPRKVLLVASRAENVTIKDAQTGLLLRTLEGPKMTVYTLLYEDGKVYCGTSNHQIQVFDYTSGNHVGAHEGGKGAVCLRACGGLLFAGCYDGCVYVYREGESRPLAQIRGPGLMLLSLAILGTKIIAGFKDRSLCIWKIPLIILQEMIL